MGFPTQHIYLMIRRWALAHGGRQVDERKLDCLHCGLAGEKIDDKRKVLTVGRHQGDVPDDGRVQVRKCE